MKKTYVIKNNNSKLGPIKWLRINLRKILCLFCIILSLSLFLMDFTNRALAKKIRSEIMDHAIFILEISSMPENWFSSIGQFFKTHSSLIEEKIELTKHKRASEKNVLLIKMLRSENIRLKNLLNFLSENQDIEYLTTRIVGINNTDYIDSAFISLGKEHGIFANQAVVSEDGLIGKTIDVGKKTSQILFITDKNCKIPVITTESNVRAIMVGENKETLKLIHISDYSDIIEGESVITAGDNKFFPAGIYIGKISKDNEIYPSANLKKTDFVSIVKIKDLE